MGGNRRTGKHGTKFPVVEKAGLETREPYVHVMMEGLQKLIQMRDAPSGARDINDRA